MTEDSQPLRPVQIHSGFGETIRRFMRLETSGGLALMAMAALAMLVKNSPLSELYVSFLDTRGTVAVGPLELTKPLFLWVNDAWMAVFFFLVGMEIKRELLYGYLADRSQLILPAAAAVGGMVVPGVIYYLLNANDPIASHGWAIPTATDIAFALAVLAMLGSRVPVTLKILLMTVAVLDDLGAILIIALFYTNKLSMGALVVAVLFLLALLVLNRLRVIHLAAYVLVGTALWVCVLKSGVHATLAGVVTAFAIPARQKREDTNSLLEHTIHKLHPWVAFGILPMFAFVNAGIALQGVDLSALLEPVPLGISLGLLVGKPLGVIALSALVVLLGWTRLPQHVTWPRMAGMACLCGVGFTMSIFVASLAFQEAGIGYARVDRLAIIGASLAAGIIGYLILHATLPSKVDSGPIPATSAHDPARSA